MLDFTDAWANRQPVKPYEYYTEYVHPTPGIKGPGPQRIVTGKSGEMYYTVDQLSENYLSAVARLLQSIGCNASPAELVSMWESFVEECEVGYCWEISEYDNEIRARRALELLLDSSALKNFPQLQDLSEVVTPIDNRFRSLLQDGLTRPGKTSWYECGNLRRAGCEYAEYIRSAYNVVVQAID